MNWISLMRIVSSAVFSLVAILAILPPGLAEENSLDKKNTKETSDLLGSPVVLEFDTLKEKTDPIVTGTAIHADHLRKWELESALYQQCPECVANQPFPEE